MSYEGVTYPTQLQNIDTWKPDRIANYTGSDRKDGLISPHGNRYFIKYASRHTLILYWNQLMKHAVQELQIEDRNPIY